MYMCIVSFTIIICMDISLIEYLHVHVTYCSVVSFSSLKFLAASSIDFFSSSNSAANFSNSYQKQYKRKSCIHINNYKNLQTASPFALLALMTHPSVYLIKINLIMSLCYKVQQDTTHFTVQTMLDSVYVSFPVSLVPSFCTVSRQAHP